MKKLQLCAKKIENLRRHRPYFLLMITHVGRKTKVDLPSEFQRSYLKNKKTRLSLLIKTNDRDQDSFLSPNSFKGLGNSNIF